MTNTPAMQAAQEINDYYSQFDCAINSNLALEAIAAVIDRHMQPMREALEFYASMTDLNAVSMVMSDCGKRARAALAGPQR